MGADIRYVQMLRIELSRGLGDILTVETHTRVSDDKGVDTQVEWGMTGGVLGGQRIDDELEIGLRQRIFLIELGMGTKQLCR